MCVSYSTEKWIGAMAASCGTLKSAHSVRPMRITWPTRKNVRRPTAGPSVICNITAIQMGTTNDEIPNDERMSNDECLTLPLPCGHSYSSFVLRHSFDIRH